MSAYFAEGTDAMLALEGMVDKVGTANVLHALARICQMKANHIEENWQDMTLAQWWEKRANKIGALANAPMMHDAK